MRIEVLVSTMNQHDLSIVKQMNLQTDSIIINQCDDIGYVQESFGDMNIQMYSFNERGVGISRNNALMRSTADICLMADDDMVYVNGYEDIVRKAFMDNPKADMIMFNVPIHKKNNQTLMKVKRNQRIRYFNAMKYGTVNIAFKRDVVLKKNIYFSLLFGGGARFGSGEDSLFIRDALKRGLKIYSCKEIIANIKENRSTWFNGYNEKYFFDRGALFQAIGGTPLSFLLMVQFLIRKKKLYSNQIQLFTAFEKMIEGRYDYLNKD